MVRLEDYDEQGEAGIAGKWGTQKSPRIARRLLGYVVTG